MISTFARWLIRMQCYYLSGIFLTLVSKLAGNGSQIRYDKKGFWRHKMRNGVILNEAFPNIRLDMDAIEKFNDDVYFFEYQPQLKDICVDIGAGIGTETLSLSRKVGPAGWVYAVEASPFTYNILKSNVLENRLGNVDCFNLAISDREGKVRISDLTESHISNSLVKEGGSGDTDGGDNGPPESKGGLSGSEVDAFSMDGFLRHHGIEQVDYLKVNIEGAERLLIADFKQVSAVRHVAISCHDFLGRRNGDASLFTREAVCSFLLSNGFRIQTRDTGTDYVDDWIYGVNEKAKTD